ncbi:hypothetical protein [Azonexus hydrophilus]|uniref:hypothetical protein n=1 Tax=Azonexus hydrophilus TaxID=418702 RepID=UPI001115A36F|nr:hypothetical protein [Azonexus hydrophilus]
MSPKIHKTIILLTLIFNSSTTIASSNDRTSIDIYCESMSLALYESTLNYQAPKTPEIARRVEKSQSETLKACKAMPASGGTEKKIKKMSPEEINLVSCIGIAEGIFMAKSESTENQFSYAELTKNRNFIANACITSQKRFLSDLRKHGPKYALNQTYQNKK